ncbi:hypothetical protein, conserved [Babesia bigemina]|uniref:Uncharacterized protein n=1 Tax=Babesia bigemina TaxID=5866 RepID=A0A061D888_BABBI|nr:hypothetical protein, conserved [Babesia bigemina]CDR96197.1 hypothetical protein, conserved [Babesia bigemina]|eukprot:XP_012768383.1 hypothetical protein, conserved [Babesia bigemina]
MVQKRALDRTEDVFLFTKTHKIANVLDIEGDTQPRVPPATLISQDNTKMSIKFTDALRFVPMQVRLKVTNVTVPLDSSINLLKRDVLPPRALSHRMSRLCNPGTTDKEKTKSALLERKSVFISRNRVSRDNGLPQILRLELTNTVIVESINNLSTFPVLSVDYGSKYIGLSIHHMGKAKLLRSIYNTGDVEHLCGVVYSIVTDNIHPPSRFIILVGLPYSREEITGSEWISQTLYNLDFATRLSRYMHGRHLGTYGNWEHNVNHTNEKPMSPQHVVHNRCIGCSLNLGYCGYNNACEELFLIAPSDYSSTAVIGISEESSTYQTQIFGGRNHRRLDSLASDIIFRNLQESLNSDSNHRKPFLVLPSCNNLLRTHTRRECLLLEKTIFDKCVNLSHTRMPTPFHSHLFYEVFEILVRNGELTTLRRLLGVVATQETRLVATLLKNNNTMVPLDYMGLYSMQFLRALQNDHLAAASNVSLFIMYAQVFNEIHRQMEEVNDSERDTLRVYIHNLFDEMCTRFLDERILEDRSTLCRSSAKSMCYDLSGSCTMRILLNLAGYELFISKEKRTSIGEVVFSCITGYMKIITDETVYSGPQLTAFLTPPHSPFYVFHHEGDNVLQELLTPFESKPQNSSSPRRNHVSQSGNVLNDSMHLLLKFVTHALMEIVVVYRQSSNGDELTRVFTKFIGRVNNITLHWTHKKSFWDKVRRICSHQCSQYQKNEEWDAIETYLS